MYFVQNDTSCQLGYVGEEILVFFFHETTSEKFNFSNEFNVNFMEIMITLKNSDNRYVEIRCVVKGELVENVCRLSLKTLQKALHLFRNTEL